MRSWSNSAESILEGEHDRCEDVAGLNICISDRFGLFVMWRTLVLASVAVFVFDELEHRCHFWRPSVVVAVVGIDNLFILYRTFSERHSVVAFTCWLVDCDARARMHVACISHIKTRANSSLARMGVSCSNISVLEH